MLIQHRKIQCITHTIGILCFYVFYVSLTSSELLNTHIKINMMNWIDHILLHYLHYLLSKNAHIYTIQSRLERLRHIFETFDKIPTPEELKEWLKPRWYITRRKYKEAYNDFIEFLREVLSFEIERKL